MFRRRAGKTERRQRMLEELLWLQPAERERRIVAAVAAGDVTAEEVDATLRMITRLDSLRVLNIPKNHVLGPRSFDPDARGSQRGSGGTPRAATPPPQAAAATPPAPRPAGAATARRQPLIGEVPVVAEPVAVDVTPELIGLPVEAPAGRDAAAGAASETRDEAAPPGAQAAVPAAGPPRRRAGDPRDGMAAPRDGDKDPVAIGIPVAEPDKVEVVSAEAWPSMDWLRP